MKIFDIVRNYINEREKFISETKLGSIVIVRVLGKEVMIYNN